MASRKTPATAPEAAAVAARSAAAPAAQTAPAPAAGAGLALFDDASFFARALVYGVRHGVLDSARLQTIRSEGAKGMVQIARYFGSEYLRPQLELARDRLINLVSLELQHSSGGALPAAALALQKNSLLSRSKGGSDLLRALLALPQSSHFGLQAHDAAPDERLAQLARWSLRSYAQYQAELAQRQHAMVLLDAARWLARSLNMEDDTLEDSARDAEAEAVIRSALLAIACRQTHMPDWARFQSMLLNLRKKAQTGQMPVLALPKNLPTAYRAAVESLRSSVQDDLPRLLDPSVPPRRLLGPASGLMGRYFWLEDALSEVDHFAREASAQWSRASGGHDDDSSLLTLFLCLAADSAPKTLLSARTASTLLRKIRKQGLQPQRATDFIRTHAPESQQSDYLRLWDDFVHEAQDTLQSDRDDALRDALALLRRDCNVA